MDFLERLFSLKSVEKRFRLCVHNPSAHPRFADFCLSAKLDDQVNLSSRKKTCSDVEDVVKKSNEIRVQMLKMEKYDKYLMNPVFKVPLNQKRKLPDYYAKGRNGLFRHKKFEDQKSPTEVWEIQFPLHKAAMDDDYERTQ